MSKDVWDSCLQQEIPYEMLDLANHPTPSDLEKKLGKELVDVFLQACTPIEKILFGRDKPLKGPEGKRLWINPNDRANGEKVLITEQPSKTDCLQALTHRGILEIGEKVEKMIAEKNREDLEAAVKDAEDVSRFEADLRIKFHVENERKKLNEEWQVHFDELVKTHEEEKKNIIKIFEDSRKVFCEFMARKCHDEINKHVDEAVVNTKQEMEKECMKKIDDELVQQHTILQESMAVTLRNLEANNKDRMNELCNQCLNAMDVQSNLMMCRQITELIHLMSVEKSQWQNTLADVKDKYEMTIKMLENKLNSFIVESSPEHQSSSFIVALWKRFFKSLKSVDFNELNEFESRILNEIHRIQCELIENYDDNTSRTLLIQNDCNNGEKQDIQQQQHQKSQDENLIDDWFYRKDIECLNTNSSVAVEWERQTSSEVISIENKFMSSIFHKMSKADAPISINDSIFSKTASSIITMVKESKDDFYDDDRLLEGKVIEILRNLFIQQHPQTISDVDLVPIPNSNSLHIRDSFDINDKKISLVEEPVEGHENLLGVIDSIELLSRRGSVTQQEYVDYDNFDSTDMEDFEENTTDVSPKASASNIKPPYMEVPKYNNCLYVKMTEQEWKELKALEESIHLKSKRNSSVQFENSTLEIPQNPAQKRSSILKNPSVDLQRHDLNPNQNALHPIQQKCQEMMKNMKFNSILELLCNEDDTVDVEKSSSPSCSDSQKK